MVNAVKTAHASNAEKIVNTGLALLIAGITTVLGMLWQMRADIAGIQTSQKNAVAIRSLTKSRYNDALERIWETDKNQYHRLDALQKKSNHNQRRLSVLETRVKRLENR